MSRFTDVDIKTEQILNEYNSKGSLYANAQLPNPDNPDEMLPIGVKFANYINPDLLDNDLFVYVKKSITKNYLTIQEATTEKFGVVKLGEDCKVNEDGSISVGLALQNVENNFRGGGEPCNIVFPPDMADLAPDKYMVTNPVPLENPDGALGEVWIIKDTGKFIVYNSGSFTGKFSVSYAIL